MKGTNELVLFEAECIIAFQEYIDKRLGQYSSKVTRLSEDKIKNTFVLTLKEFTADDRVEGTAIGINSSPYRGGNYSDIVSDGGMAPR